MKFLLYSIILLINICCLANAEDKNKQQLSWQGQAAGGFTASISASPAHHLNIGQPLIMHVTLTFPSTYQPLWETIILNLFIHNGFSPPPFTLTDQKITPRTPLAGNENYLSQELTIITTAQMPGAYNLSFYEIPFLNSSNGEKVSIISGIFPMEVTKPDLKFDASLVAAPPMSVSKDLPITITAANWRNYIVNPKLISEAIHYNNNTVHDKTIPWQFFSMLITLLILCILIISFSRTNKSNTK